MPIQNQKNRWRRSGVRLLYEMLKPSKKDVALHPPTWICYTLWTRRSVIKHIWFHSTTRKCEKRWHTFSQCTHANFHCRKLTTLSWTEWSNLLPFFVATTFEAFLALFRFHRSYMCDQEWLCIYFVIPPVGRRYRIKSSCASSRCSLWHPKW